MAWLGKMRRVLGRFSIADKIMSSKRAIAESCEQRSFAVPEWPLEFADLRNGMRLACDCRDDTSVTTLGFVLPAGSMHEEPNERGASLFMEHLLFRRTKCRSRDEIAEVVDRTGAKLSATALRDMFVLYGTVPCYEIEPLVELLADIVINGISCDDDIVAERFCILRELADIENDQEKVVMDYLVGTAYQGTELGESVYPETDVIKNMRVEAVESFRRRLFRPSLMTMICTGGTSFADIQSLANEYFASSSKNTCLIEEQCTPSDYPCSPCFRYTGSDMRLRDDDLPMGHVAIAVEGPGHANCQDHCSLNVAKEFVGSWDLGSGGGSNNAPYLAQRAFNTDMCHVYKSFNIGWANTGLWGCYFACDKMKLEDMMWMVQNEWMRLCSEIKSKEVDRAINQCITREILRLEDPVERFNDIGSWLYRRGCYETLNHRIEKYKASTLDKLIEVANKYIYDQCPAVASIGPIEELSDYNRIRAYMYRLRH